MIILLTILTPRPSWMCHLVALCVLLQYSRVIILLSPYFFVLLNAHPSSRPQS